MTETLLGRLSYGIRALGPAVVTAFLVLVVLVPWPLPLPEVPPPAIGVMAAFYWGLHRPALLPAFAVFTLGVMQDALGGGVLGLGALVMLIAYGVARWQRRFLLGKPFAVEWWAFAMVAAGAAALGWAVVAVLAGEAVGFRPALAQALVTVAFYPPVAWLFGLLRRAVPE